MSETNKHRLVAVFVFLIAFCWKLFFITERPLCLDEPYTIFHAQQGLFHVVSLAIEKEPTPPLFMALVWLVNKVVGLSVFGLRLLPLLFNSLTSVVLFKIGTRIGSIYTGILASSFLIFSSYHFYFGLELRTYSLMSFGVSLSIYQLIKFIQTPSKTIFWHMVLANLLLVYANYFGWLIIGTQALFVSLLFFSNKQVVKQVWLSTLLTAAFFGPFLYFLVIRFLAASKGTWIPAPNPISFKNEIYAFVNSSTVLWVALSCAFAGLLLYFIGLAKSKYIQPTTIKILIMCILLFFVPYAFMFGISFKIPMFINRYILFCSIPLYISLAALATIFFNYKSLQIIFVGLVSFFSGFYLKILPHNFYYRDIAHAVSFTKTEAKTYIIYPKWTELNFAFHFDKALFANYQDFHQTLSAKNIFPVWNFDDVKQIVAQSEYKKITLFVNGSSQSKECIEIRNYLNKTLIKVDSTYFEEYIYVNQYQIP